MAEAGAPLMLAVSWVRAPLFVNVTLPAAVFPVVAVKVALAVFVGASLSLSSLHPRAVKIERPIKRKLIRMMAVVSREVEVKALFLARCRRDRAHPIQIRALPATGVTATIRKAAATWSPTAAQ